MNDTAPGFNWKWFFKLALACILVVSLVASVDFPRVIRALAHLEWVPLSIALVLFVPQVIVSAIRWRGWVTSLSKITFTESVRQTLAASALNLALPAKMGDLSKAGMLELEESHQRPRAVFRATVEKLTDVSILALFIVVGTLGISSKIVFVVGAILFLVAWLIRRRVTPASQNASAWLCLVAWTTVLWYLHLAQLHLFLHAAGVSAPWETTTARMPLAIFAGLLPVSYCGIGTRDAALVAIFSDIAPAASMLVVGMLTALRYLIPGAVGIALLGGYLPTLSKSRWRGSAVASTAA